MNDLVLSEDEYRTLQEGIAAWLEQQRTDDPDAIWRQVAIGETFFTQIP